MKITDISSYNNAQVKKVTEVCKFLEIHIQKFLKGGESKLWHGSPVWFLDGNPIVAYSVKKGNKVSLMFFSGQSFDEKELIPVGKFKAAEVLFEDASDIQVTKLKKWIKKSMNMQWDYKNIVKRKGVLVKATKTHDQRIQSILFSDVYPMYVTKVERKGRTKKELNQVITWLTGFDTKTIQSLIKEEVSFETFFKRAKLHKNAHMITGVICGYRIEDIQDPLTQKIRYVDKLVDELAKGRAMEKILRSE